jgi:hypothetical protein
MRVGNDDQIVALAPVGVLDGEDELPPDDES